MLTQMNDCGICVVALCMGVLIVADVSALRDVVGMASMLRVRS
jgi:hypothetical protein